MIERYIFTPSEALDACAAVIDKYEDGAVMSEACVQFARQMFAKLEYGDAQMVIESYPFCEIISGQDWPI